MEEVAGDWDEWSDSVTACLAVSPPPHQPLTKELGDNLIPKAAGLSREVGVRVRGSGRG